MQSLLRTRRQRDAAHRGSIRSRMTATPRSISPRRERVALDIAPAGGESEQRDLGAVVRRRRAASSSGDRATCRLRHRRRLAAIRGASDPAGWRAVTDRRHRRRASSSRRSPPWRPLASCSSTRLVCVPVSSRCGGPRAPASTPSSGTWRVWRGCRASCRWPRRCSTPSPTLLRGRSLFVIDDGERRAGWSAWLAASRRRRAPSCPVVRDASRIRRRLKALRSSRCRLTPWCEPCVPECSRRPLAARPSSVTPSGRTGGRAVSRVWSGASRRAIRSQRHRRTGPPIPGAALDSFGEASSLRAAEQPAVYGVAEPTRRASAATRREHVPRDARRYRAVARPHRARNTAGCRGTACARRTHPASGDRRAGAARRVGADAGEGSLALARSSWFVGVGRRTRRTVLTARPGFLAPGRRRDRVSIDVAVLTATASLELARLDQAETAVERGRRGGACARRRGESRPRPRGPGADAVLACSIRRSRGDPAVDGVVEAATAPEAMVGERPRGRRSPSGWAISVWRYRAATEALLDAQRLADARLVAQAARSAAFAHLAVGDLPPCRARGCGLGRGGARLLVNR